MPIYLQGLGVTAIWLMPFQPSPGKDDGYDITDYYGVDPRFGTLGDFVELTHGAKLRGIRVIIDLVANHTSDQHPWFQAARADPGSHYHDLYVWSDSKPPNANEGMVFPGVQKTTWTRDAKARKILFPSLLRASARPQHCQRRSAGGNPENYRLLATTGRRRLPHGCRTVPD